MNVAITCDSLISRNHANEIVELLCETYPDSMIYTLAHKPKAILGTIEQRKIKSSGLSRKVQKEHELYDHLLVLPSIAKSMKLSCQHNIVLNISRGFSHAFSVCEKSKQITYLYDLSFENNFNGFLNKLLKPFIVSKFMSALKNSNLVLVSDEKLKIKLKKFGIESVVLLPPFKISDYALFPKSMFKHDYFTVDTTGLTLSAMKTLINFFEKRQERFQFIGALPEHELSELKKIAMDNCFFGDRCSGEHAPVLASSRAFISFSTEKFPKMILACLAVGRPVVMLKEQNCIADGVGTYFIEKFDMMMLSVLLDQVNNEHETLDSQKIRANALKYHDIKFKSHLKRLLDKEMGLAASFDTGDELA